MVIKFKNWRHTIEGDGKTDEWVESVEYDLRLDHAIVVQFTEVPHRADTLLVVLGMVHLMTDQPRLPQSTVNITTTHQYRVRGSSQHPAYRSLGIFTAIFV